MGKLIEWFNIRTGFRYWYAVRMEYRPKMKGGVDGRFGMISLTHQVGLARKQDILNGRVLRKTLGKWVERLSHDKIKNGMFAVSVVCYLGYFRRERPK